MSFLTIPVLVRLAEQRVRSFAVGMGRATAARKARSLVSAAALDRVYCAWGILPPRRGGQPLLLIYQAQTKGDM